MQRRQNKHSRRVFLSKYPARRDERRSALLYTPALRWQRIEPICSVVSLKDLTR
jgi:hypothetical protein